MPNVDEKERLEKQKDDLELSDDDLDAVSGGLGGYMPSVPPVPAGGPKGFEDPLVASTPSIGFELPQLRGK